MGSKPGTAGFPFDDTVWIDPIDIVRGRLSQLSLDGGSADLTVLGVLLFVYLTLKLRLSLAGFDADFYPYDWRRDIRQLGHRLAGGIGEETGGGAGRQDLDLVAHSMDGLVARTGFKHLEDANETERVQRLIMLGTRNFWFHLPGAGAPGNHSLVKKVAAIDIPNTHQTLVNEVFNTFTGL